MGPGNVTKALRINLDCTGIDVTKAKSSIVIRQGIDLKDADIVISKRIGISKAQEKLWRFDIENKKVKEMVDASILCTK